MPPSARPKLTHLAWAFLASGCGPPMGMVPVAPLGQDVTELGVGGVFSMEGAYVWREVEGGAGLRPELGAPAADAMGWVATELPFLPRANVGVTAFLGMTSFGGGVFGQYDFLASERFTFGPRLEVGWLWVGAAPVFSVRSAKDVEIFTSPTFRVGETWAGLFPLGVSAPIGEAWQLRVEGSYRYPGGAYTTDTVSSSFGVDHFDRYQIAVGVAKRVGGP